MQSIESRRKIDNWGGGGGGRGHINIFVFRPINFFETETEILKSIVFTVCEQEYMNMGTSNNRSSDSAESINHKQLKNIIQNTTLDSRKIPGSLFDYVEFVMNQIECKNTPPPP